MGASGVVVQLLSTALLMDLFNLAFQQALPVAVITAASSNYLVNNALTFRDRRQSGRQLIRGLLKFLLVASLPALANVGLADYYTLIKAHTLWAQLAGIVVVYVWNYAASSRFVWNNPSPAWLPIGLGSLLRLVQIWMPVLGVHSWRQADTRPWPGISAWRAHRSGCRRSTGGKRGLRRVGISLYPFLVSRLYGLMGVQEWLGRSLSVLFSALTIWLVMRLGRRWFNPEAGWWAGLALPSHLWGCTSDAPFKPKPCCCCVPQEPWRA